MLRILLAVIGIISLSTTASAQAQPQRILFVGNSLTSHGPKADIDWHGNWGMAATSLDKDYVHVVTKALALRRDDMVRAAPPARRGARFVFFFFSRLLF